MTPRQSAVAACLLDGMSVRQSARAIGMQPTQVQREVNRLMDKLREYSRERLALKLKELA